MLLLVILIVVITAKYYNKQKKVNMQKYFIIKKFSNFNMLKLFLHY